MNQACKSKKMVQPTFKTTEFSAQITHKTSFLIERMDRNGGEKNPTKLQNWFQNPLPKSTATLGKICSSVIT